MSNNKIRQSDCACCVLLPPILFPTIALVTVILFSLAFFCPNTPSLDDMSQITVSPKVHSNGSRPDGPTFWFGIFGSCARSNAGGVTACTDIKFNPKYDFSVLPSNAPTYVFENVPLYYKVSGYIAFGLWPILFITVVLICRHLLSILRMVPQSKGWFVPILLKIPLLPWMGAMACLIGGMNFWSLGLYFDVICNNFNEFIALQGPRGPNLIASRGSALELGFVSCALFVLPWIALVYVQLLHGEDSDKVPETVAPDDKQLKDASLDQELQRQVAQLAKTLNPEPKKDIDSQVFFDALSRLSSPNALGLSTLPPSPYNPGSALPQPSSHFLHPYSPHSFYSPQPSQYSPFTTPFFTPQTLSPGSIQPLSSTRSLGAPLPNVNSPQPGTTRSRTTALPTTTSQPGLLSLPSTPMPDLLPMPGLLSLPGTPQIPAITVTPNTPVHTPVLLPTAPPPDNSPGSS